MQTTKNLKGASKKVTDKEVSKQVRKAIYHPYNRGKKVKKK